MLGTRYSVLATRKMANILDIRRRIRSVTNTRQITKAMKMVSAAKLRRAQERALAARPYAQMLTNVLKSLVSRAESTIRIPASLEHPLAGGTSGEQHLADRGDRRQRPGGCFNYQYSESSFAVSGIESRVERRDRSHRAQRPRLSARVHILRRSPELRTPRNRSASPSVGEHDRTSLNKVDVCTGVGYWAERVIDRYSQGQIDSGLLGVQRIQVGDRAAR